MKAKRSRGFRRIGFAAAVVVVALAVLSVALPATGFFTFLVPPAEPQQKYYGPIQEALGESGELRPTERPDYLPREVYALLPPFPKDFYYLDGIITNQEGIVDLEHLEEGYWKQPEFYPTWESSGVSRTANPDRERDTFWGWGAYPADQGFVTSPGVEFNVTTFLHASWTVQSYQGMKLVPAYPGSAEIKGVTYKSRQDADKYISLAIHPDLILLGPTFPRFDPGWAHKIVVTVKVAENTPPGDYVAGVNPTLPPLEAKREWTLAHKLRYTDAGTTGIQRPYFQMLIQVQPASGRV